MKKVLAVVMAVLMTFGVFAIGVSAIDNTETCTYADALAGAKDKGGVLLIFNFADCDVGTIPSGTNSFWKKIAGGSYDGCYVFYGTATTPGLPLNVPGIKNPPEGYSAHWVILDSNMQNADLNRTIPSTGNFTVPDKTDSDVDGANGRYIYFTAVTYPEKKTNVLQKILDILTKIIGALLGEELAAQIGGILGGLAG